MRLISTVASFALLSFGGCATPRTIVAPPPANVASAPALAAASDKQASVAAANVQAARDANKLNPDGNPKVAVEGSLATAAANLPAPAKADQDSASANVAAALAGKLDAANSGWAKAQAEADRLNDQIVALKKQVADERAEAARQLQAQLQAAHDEERQKAAAEQRHLIGWIFYGGGALLIAGSAGMFWLGASIPFVGPRAAFATGSAGGVLIFCGVALSELLQHPNVIWWGLGIAAALLATASGLMLSNHFHHVNQPTPKPA